MNGVAQRRYGRTTGTGMGTGTGVLQVWIRVYYVNFFMRCTVRLST